MSEVPDAECPIQTGEGRFLGQELMGSVDGLGSFAFVYVGQRRVQVLQWPGGHPRERSWCARLSEEMASHSSAVPEA